MFSLFITVDATVGCPKNDRDLKRHLPELVIDKNFCMVKGVQ